MQNLSHERCVQHALREAAARCPGCLQFFCRECITEHDDRLLCASCLKKTVREAAPKKLHLAVLARALQVIVSFLFLWLVFYGVGQALLSIPSAFHDGTIWKDLTSLAP